MDNSVIRVDKLDKKNNFRLVSFFKKLPNKDIIQFLLICGSGVIINLATTFWLTEFIFGLENYFLAYIIGLSANLIYNFILHTKITFNSKKNHTRRFVVFVIYSIAMTFFQAFIVKTVTPIIGLKYYLLVISITILIFSLITFMVFKFFLFKEN